MIFNFLFYIEVFLCECDDFYNQIKTKEIKKIFMLHELNDVKLDLCSEKREVIYSNFNNGFLLLVGL